MPGTCMIFPGVILYILAIGLNFMCFIVIKDFVLCEVHKVIRAPLYFLSIISMVVPFLTLALLLFIGILAFVKNLPAFIVATAAGIKEDIKKLDED